MKQLGELGDMDRNAQKAVEITGWKKSILNGERTSSKLEKEGVKGECY